MGTGAVGSATSAAPPSTRAGWARRAGGVTPEGRLPLLRLASGESSTWLLAGQRSRPPQAVGAPWLTRWRPWGSEPRAAPSRRAVFAHRRVRTRDQRGRDDRGSCTLTCTHMGAAAARPHGSFSYIMVNTLPNFTWNATHPTRKIRNSVGPGRCRF